MKPTMKRNLLVVPIVILVRAPVMLPLLALVKIGELADAALDWVWHRLPGFER